MAGIVSFANVGAVADDRTQSGDLAQDYIGTTQDPFTHGLAPPSEYDEKADKRNVSELGPAQTSGHNTIYLDSSINFETYHWWANRSREVEKHITTEAGLKQVFNVALGKGIKSGQEAPPDHMVGHDMGVGRADSEKPQVTSEVNNEKESPNGSDGGVSEGHNNNFRNMSLSGPRWGVTEAEWERASRATRTATWGSVFYLITTDILGPYSVPYAFAQMGYGPGTVLFTVFGIMAYYAAMQLWKMFIGLDSTRYPLRNYGDLAFRVYGTWARIVCNVLQSFQFFLNVVLLIESNGQGIAQMAAGPSGVQTICFIACEAIFMAAGFIFGQIRTLQRLGFLANLAIWLNVVVIFMTMAVTSEYGPNYAANAQFGITGPIQTYGYWPKPYSLQKGISGLMNGVFSYGGATLFNELMVEMRRPNDFWKSLLLADIFIYAVYMTMGLVVYSYQGQYAFNPAYQGIPATAYRFQTLGNAIGVIAGLIAALLYGNIGIKVLYSSVFIDLFKFPPLDNKKGKWIWVVFVPLYWGIAWIIAAAIPQITNLIVFVGAACILQFSYTFPPILMVGYNCQKDAMLPEEEFNPRTGEAKRVDNGLKRWMRGYKKKFFLNTFDIVFFLGSLAAAGLGIYSAVIGMHEVFTTTPITSFTCCNPAGARLGAPCGK